MIILLDLNKQYQSIRSEIDKAIASVIADSAFIAGKYVNAFEQDFAEYLRIPYCIGVGNGTDALEIAIDALDLGGEIIVPANSFIASAEAVTRSGYKVVFCDCNTDDYTLLVDDVRRRITSNTKAIMAVHLYGHTCAMDEIVQLAKKHNLRIIEDCAQAHGAEYKGKRIGTLSDVAAFSFYPGKNLGAYGDGGAIITNSESLATRCRMIANHGSLSKYDHEFEGRNSRLDGLQAAILSIKLRYLDNWIEARRRAASNYLAELASIEDLLLPAERDGVKHAYHLFVVRCDQRDQLYKSLRQKDIQTGIHYPVALPRLKAYSKYHAYAEKFYANNIAEQLLSLPMGEHLESSEVAYVVQSVKQFFGS